MDNSRALMSVDEVIQFYHITEALRDFFIARNYKGDSDLNDCFQESEIERRSNILESELVKLLMAAERATGEHIDLDLNFEEMEEDLYIGKFGIETRGRTNDAVWADIGKNLSLHYLRNSKVYILNQASKRGGPPQKTLNNNDKRRALFSHIMAAVDGLEVNDVLGLLVGQSFIDEHGNQKSKPFDIDLNYLLESAQSALPEIKQRMVTNSENLVSNIESQSDVFFLGHHICLREWAYQYCALNIGLESVKKTIQRSSRAGGR